MLEKTLERVPWTARRSNQSILKEINLEHSLEELIPKLQYHGLKASILQHSAFLLVQLSHPYMTNGKIITLTRRTFVDKLMFLLFNTLSRFVIAFLTRNRNCKELY